jgi:hypothetical protein
MMLRYLATVAALSLAVDASAQTPSPPPSPSPALPTVSAVRSGDLLLVPGRQLTITWKMGAPPAQVSERDAGPNVMPRAPSDPNYELWFEGKAPDSFPRAAPGQIGFTLWVEEGRGTTLVASSGQTEPFFYMANMIVRREGRLVAEPTTICAVQPGLVGIEIWPYAVEGVQIVGLGTSPADMCYDHAARKGYKVGEQPPSNAPKPAAPAATSPAPTT